MAGEEEGVLGVCVSYARNSSLAPTLYGTCVRAAASWRLPEQSSAMSPAWSVVRTATWRREGGRLLHYC